MAAFASSGTAGGDVAGEPSSASALVATVFRQFWSIWETPRRPRRSLRALAYGAGARSDHKPSIKPRSRTAMGLFSKDIKTLDDLFVHTLQDIYYAENQI